MQIKKMNDMMEVENQFDVELQGCSNDCKEYFAKTKGDYEVLRDLGYKVDGTASVEEIRQIKADQGYYCYRLLTPKTNIYL